MTDTEWLEKHDFKLVSRADFEEAGDLPVGLLERSESIEGAWVVYDPLDDHEGFLLIDDDKDALARIARDHLDSKDETGL